MVGEKLFYNEREAWAALPHLTAVDGTQTKQVDVEQSGTKKQQVQTASSSEIDTESGKSIESGKLYQVNSPVVRLRNTPDANATIITELKNGEKVTIFQESYGWGKTFYNGKEVWIALYLLDEKSEKDSLMSEVSEKADSQPTTEKIEKEESEVESGQKDDKKEKTTVESWAKEKTQYVQTDQSGEKTLSGYHIVIDPGHGGKDTGAIGTEVYEKKLTLSTAKKIEEQLRDKGATVTLTRTDDTFMPLEERTQISNSTDTDAFISLHYNASEDQSAHGVYTFYYGGDENQKLANSIQKSLINYVNLTDRGAKQADYQVLRDNNQLALLIELGFVSNPEEQKLVQTDKYQEKAAKGIVTGLEDYFK